MAVSASGTTAGRGTKRQSPRAGPGSPCVKSLCCAPHEEGSLSSGLRSALDSEVTLMAGCDTRHATRAVVVAAVVAAQLILRRAVPFEECRLLHVAAPRDALLRTGGRLLRPAACIWLRETRKDLVTMSRHRRDDSDIIVMPEREFAR